MTLQEVYNILKSASLAQPNINTVEDDFLKLNREDTKYSAIVIQEREHNTVGEFIEYSFFIGYVDRLTDDKSNEVAIHSTGINVLKNIVSSIKKVLYPVVDIRAGRYVTFNERFTAECAGVYTDVVLSVPESECADFDFHIGGDVDLRPLFVESNGVYEPVGFDGYSKVTVDVPSDDKEVFTLRCAQQVEYDDELYRLVEYFANGGKVDDCIIRYRLDDDRVEYYAYTDSIDLYRTGEGEFILQIDYDVFGNIEHIYIERYYDDEDKEYYYYAGWDRENIITNETIDEYPFPAENVYMDYSSDMFDFDNVKSGVEQIAASTEYLSYIKANRDDLKMDFFIRWNSETKEIVSDYSDYKRISDYVKSHAPNVVNVYMVDEKGTYTLMESVIYTNKDGLVVFGTDGWLNFDIWEENETIVYSIYDRTDEFATKEWVESKGYGDVNHLEENDQYLRQINPFDIQWVNKVKNTSYQVGPNGNYGKTKGSSNDAVGFIIEEGDGDLYVISRRGDDEIKVRPDGITFTDADGSIVLKKDDVVTKDWVNERIGILEDMTKDILDI